ncbi:MAG: carbohydrate binding family 9 domain-containing protein [Acidobacteria bacterium]|nr:carbohydrate binding family 9 domain-containing protein [Acidobacteriota bacterium]
MRATRLASALTLDGRLDEEIYREIAPASDFIQQDPGEGEPAHDKTEVWVFFDDRNMYVAARCWDEHPEQIVANELRRDHINIYNNDNFAVGLDTFYDRRNGYLFQTNAIGGIGDGYMTDEKEHNRDWSTVWETRSRIDERGWTLEMAIPFKSLRYASAGPQTWGILFRRIVRGSRNEHSFLTRIPAAAGGGGIYRMSRAATLVGLEAPARSRNIEIKPYAISSLMTDATAEPAIRNDPDGNAGVDVKYGVTRGLTADFTYNTDFAQVEDDVQQVNLTRFSQFFPEKRDFFLEGQGIFAFGGVSGQTGRGLGTTIPTETPVLFFSRRIGLNRGRSVPIIGGGRVTGRAGKYSIGALSIETDDAEATGAAQTNFSAFRVKRDILRRSNVGVIMTRRAPLVSASSGAAAGGGTNTVGGIDANFSFFQALNILGYYAKSDTPALDGRSASWRATLDYGGDRYGLQLERLVVEEHFDPQLGFLRRSDFRRSFAGARFSPRPKDSRLFRKVGVDASFDDIENGDGGLETRQMTAGLNVELNNSDRWQVDYNRELEAIHAPFLVAGKGAVARGDYQFQALSATYTLGPRRRINGSLRVGYGSFYAGDRTEASYSGRVEISARVSIEPTINVDWIDLPSGAFVSKLFSSRTNVTFTPRMALGALVQYNASNDSLGANVRFRWEYTPGSDFYVVYGEGRDTALEMPGALATRTFVVKITRLLRF